MAWKLPRQPHRVFQRNPLVAVIVELRYHPILKVPAKVADYQERVRTTFPAFQQLQTQTVSFGPGPVHVRGGETYNFTKADESSVLSLATGSMSLESRHHELPSDFTFASVGLMSGEPLSGPRPERRQIVEYSAINASETPLPVGLRPVSLLLPSTGAVQVGDRLVGGASPLERLVAASVAHVEAIASALPIDAEDERIVDELMSKRAASIRIRPLGPGRTGSR